MAKRVSQFLTYFLMISAFLALSTSGSFSQILPEGQCGFGILKEAPQEEGSIPFEFLQVLNGVESVITVFSGEDVPSPVFLNPGETVSFTELPQEGWTLEDIECFEGVGVEITETEDSVTFECVNPTTFSIGVCVFLNRVSADKIPTLSEWGMISAAVGLALIGVFFAVRQRLRASEQSDARG